MILIVFLVVIVICIIIIALKGIRHALARNRLIVSGLVHSIGNHFREAKKEVYDEDYFFYFATILIGITVAMVYYRMFTSGETNIMDSTGAIIGCVFLGFWILLK